MFWNKPTALTLPALQVLLDQEYAQTVLLIRSGMDFCADLIPESCGILPDFTAVVRQGYALAGRAGSLQRLDELWADPKVRRHAAGLCFPRNVASRLLRRAVNETPDLTPAEYRQLRQDAMLAQQESLPSLSTLSFSKGSSPSIAPAQVTGSHPSLFLFLPPHQKLTHSPAGLSP